MGRGRTRGPPLLPLLPLPPADDGGGDVAGEDEADAIPLARWSSDASSTTSGDSGDVATVSSQSQSPSRAPSEKSTTFVGNKPRPLRLVQENSDAVKADAASKRASWMPWGWGANGAAAAAKKDDGLAESVIRE